MTMLGDDETMIADAINSGGSGRGMSYYSVASRCGRRAKLDDALRDARREGAQDGQHVPALPSEKHALVIGSIYHLLHEQLRKPREGLVLDMMAGVFNVNVIEARRMFRGWVSIWGRNYWGHPIAIELKLPGDDELRKRVIAMMGGEVTGTFDMVTELSEEDATRAQRRLPGITAGRYIVDWKTADGETDGVALTQGLQALWYPALWNMAYPQLPVDGIIFDIAMKRGRRKDRAMYAHDFQAVLVRTASDCVEKAIGSLRGMVRQGTLNVLQDTPNRAECIDWRGQTCPHFNGACDGVLKEQP